MELVQARGGFGDREARRQGDEEMERRGDGETKDEDEEVGRRETGDGDVWRSRLPRGDV
jgi:hypothetical protein